jgi:hypothetical protein
MTTTRKYDARNTQPGKTGATGFSAIEMLITLALLTVVLGVVVKGVIELQARNFNETGRVDAVEEARDFIDQMARDMHGAGYPPPAVTAQASPYCTDLSFNGVVNAAVRNNVNIACGIVSFSTRSVTYEADLDGSGTVSVIYLSLVPPTGSTNCPCILQRGVITKTQWLANAAPSYFTTVNGVLNSGNGAGAATYAVSMSGPGSYASYGVADAFDAYNANGTLITTACSLTTNPDCTQIRSLQITANVAPPYYDPQTHLFPVYSITSKARINF